MVKQRNIFTGKVDILTDPSDDKGTVALALHALGSKAGKVVKSNAKLPPPSAPVVTNQIGMF